MSVQATKRDVDRVAAGIRRRVLLHTIGNNGGYLCQACSSAETLATLYLRVMHLGPSAGPLIPREFDGVPGPGRSAGSGGAYNGERGPDNDRFLLSCTHYSLGLYAALIEVGRLDERALDHYDRDGSTVEQIGAEHSPGIEVTTGSLAQALSIGLGIALARRERGERGRVWVYMSDGELQEGQTWEALSLGAHHGLDRLGVYLDANGSQCDGPISAVQEVEPITERVRCFGWKVHEVDGHDSDALAAPASEPSHGKPLFVIARTCSWRGIPSLEARANKHYVRFRPGEAELALSELHLSAEGARS